MLPLYEAGRLLRFLLHREDWALGVIAQPADEIVREGIRAPVQWLALPRPRTMLADPGVLLDNDGTMTVFAEFLDYRVNRGEIWAGIVPPGGDPAEVTFLPLLRRPHHMSYPFPFTDDDGRIRLTAETWQAGSALSWKRQGSSWVEGEPLFPGRQVVDPTLWRDGGRWWLFCGFEDDRPNERLHLFHTARLGTAWTAHPSNPVRQDRSCARSAGPIFRSGDLLVRPAQDCSTTYGAAVMLMEIQRLDLERFEERPVRRLAPEPGPYPDGLHTFCPAGAVTLIDGKRMRLDPVGVPARLRARFGHLLA